MIKKLIGSKKESNNGKVKKSKDGFSIQLEEEESTSNSTPVAEQPATVVTEKTSPKTTPTQPVTTADTPDWVKLLSKQSNQGTSATNTEENGTFADKYLLTTTPRSRRRPGGSMIQYMDMASQIKTPPMKR